MTFLGLVGLYDPPRKDIQKSIQECHNAGIRVIMATGDQAATAVAMGKRGTDAARGSEKDSR
ncbi:MAG: hypothetical protein R6V15_03065 [Desulfotignum sp.]